MKHEGGSIMLWGGFSAADPRKQGRITTASKWAAAFAYEDHVIWLKVKKINYVDLELELFFKLYLQSQESAFILLRCAHIVHIRLSQAYEP